jgi:hypothetical protein
MKKTLLLLLVVTLVAVCMRLYPTLLSGEPYSTDAWAPIKNAQILSENTPIPLNSPLFDQYNNYWPANSLFGVAFGAVLGIPAFDATAWGVPLAAALTVIVFFALVYVLTKNSTTAIFGALILATIYPYSVFVSGVTKEAYAAPLFMLCLLLFCIRRGGAKWGTALLFAVACVGLVMSHHLTNAVALVVLATLAVGVQARRIRQGLSLDKYRLGLVLILAAVTALYMGVFAHAGLNYSLATSDYLSAASYLVLAFTFSLFFSLRIYKPSLTGTVLTCSTAAAIVVLLVLLGLNRSIVAGVPPIPPHYLVYASPFFVTVPLAILGAETLLNKKTALSEVPLFWLGAVLALCGFAVFAGSAWSILFFRLLNFLCLPLALLCAVGFSVLWRSAETQRRLRRGFVRSAVAVALVAVVGLGAFCAYGSVSLQERYLQHYWLYRGSDFKAASWVATATAGANLTVWGDAKTCLLLQDYFGVHVDSLKGFQYLNAEGDLAPQVLVVYGQMAKSGYVFNLGYGVELPKNWTAQTDALNLVYSNGEVQVNCGGGHD